MNTERTPLFLMANLGAEVNRLISASESGDSELLANAKVRAIKILDQIKQFAEMKTREPELVVLGEVIEEIGTTNILSTVSPQDLKSYFIPFSLRLMA